MGQPDRWVYVVVISGRVHAVYDDQEQANSAAGTNGVVERHRVQTW
jgi:uncharacterized cupin superfamily protein